MISVITYNVHFGKKIDQIIGWFNSLQLPIDIICFQEFPLVEIKRFLQAYNKGQYHFEFATGLMRSNKRYGELTLVNRKKISITDHKIIHLGSGYFEKKIAQNKSDRSALITKLLYKKQEFMMVNLHLICYALNSKRINQLQQTIEHLDKFSEYKEVPSIFLGDFNYSSIIRQKKLIDLMKSHNFINSYKANTHKLMSLKNHQVDYVFYRYTKINNIEVLNLPYSDHFPILFKIKV